MSISCTVTDLSDRGKVRKTSSGKWTFSSSTTAWFGGQALLAPGSCRPIHVIPLNIMMVISIVKNNKSLLNA